MKLGNFDPIDDRPPDDHIRHDSDTGYTYEHYDSDDPDYLDPLLRDYIGYTYEHHDLDEPDEHMDHVPDDCIDYDSNYD